MERSDPLTDFGDLLRPDDGPDAGGTPSAPRRGARIAWIVAGSLVLLLVLGAGGYVAWCLTAPVVKPTTTVATPPALAADPVTVLAPTDGIYALEIEGADAYWGGPAVWNAGLDERRPIASISKLITAMVVLDAHPLSGPSDSGPTITFSKADADLYDKYYLLGATIMEMPEGSSLTERDVLAALLLPSASNYAEAFANWAFGSQSGFRSATADWLSAHGLSSTTIVEPTGINAENTSTPRDMMTLARLAAADETIASIAGSQTVVLSTGLSVSNTNDMLGVDGITGLKTGNLGLGTYNLLYTAAFEVTPGTPVTAIGVTLGGATRTSLDAAVQRFLESIQSGFQTVPLSSAGRNVGHVTTPWGSEADLVIRDESSILVWSDTPITVEMNTSPPTEFRDGEVVGSITWTAGPNTVSSDVVVRGDIRPPDAAWRLTHPDQLG